MISGNKEGPLPHLPVSYHNQNPLPLLWKSHSEPAYCATAEVLYYLQKVHSSTALQVIMTDAWPPTTPPMWPGCRKEGKETAHASERAQSWSTITQIHLKNSSMNLTAVSWSCGH